MATIYQSSDGQWIVFVGGVKTFFATQEEAISMADKVKYSKQAQDWCTRLAALFREAPDLEGVYFDEGFDVAGIDPITDGDIEDLGITAANVGAFITVAQQLQKFDIGDGGDPVTTANYGASVNAMRTDV
jgi:hypothetical protein